MSVCMYVCAGGRHAAAPREWVTEGGGWVTSYISARYMCDNIFVHMYVCMCACVYVCTAGKSAVVPKERSVEGSNTLVILVPSYASWYKMNEV